MPLYRSRATIHELYRQLKEELQETPHEILFINDASPDDSGEMVCEIQKKDPNVRVFSFAGNVGQQRAVLKGLELSKGSIVVSMDADLQDLPADLSQLIHKLGEGYEAVFAGRSGQYQSFSRLCTSKIFKTWLSRITGVPKDAGLFVAMSRKMVDHVVAISMTPPFVVAMIGFTSLPTTSIPIERRKRVEGRSAYSFWGRLKIGSTAILQAYRWKRAQRHLDYQKEYYAKADHRNNFPENYPLHIQRCIEKVYPHVAKDKRILEIGCGMGRFTIPLAQSGVNIEGLDLSPDLLKSCRDLAPEIPVHLQDILSPIPKNLHSFDGVVGFFVLHHLSDLDQAFRSVFSLLGPQGKAVFIEPNPYNLLYYLQIALTPKMRWKAEKYMINMRRSKIEKAAKGAGFKEFSLERFGFFPPFLYERWKKIEERLEKVSPFYPILPYQVFLLEK